MPKKKSAPKKKSKSQRLRPAISAPPWANCAICSHLGDHEYAFHKFGWEEDDTHLPRQANSLESVKCLEGHTSSRERRLKQCPTCKTFYLYRTEYEFFAPGSEDEEFLTRLTDKEAAEISATTTT